LSPGQYTITLDKKRGFVHVIARGEIIRAVGDEIITKARMKAAECRCNIFCDVRETTVKVGFAEWYFLPRRLNVYKNLKARFIRTAILISPGKQEKIYKFFEIVAQNLGLNIRIFLDEAKALAWLKKFSENNYL
jgi:hypothetical protein